MIKSGQIRLTEIHHNHIWNILFQTVRSFLFCSYPVREIVLFKVLEISMVKWCLSRLAEIRHTQILKILSPTVRSFLKFLFSILFISCSWGWSLKNTRNVSGQMRTASLDWNSSHKNFEFLFSEAQEFSVLFISWSGGLSLQSITIFNGKWGFPCLTKV